MLMRLASWNKFLRYDTGGLNRINIGECRLCAKHEDTWPTIPWECLVEFKFRKMRMYDVYDDDFHWLLLYSILHYQLGHLCYDLRGWYILFSIFSWAVAINCRPHEILIYGSPYKDTVNASSIFLFYFFL
jgi:hypothetical protein